MITFTGNTTIFTLLLFDSDLVSSCLYFTHIQAKTLKCFLKSYIFKSVQRRGSSQHVLQCCFCVTCLKQWLHEGIASLSVTQQKCLHFETIKIHEVLCSMRHTYDHMPESHILSKLRL